MDKFNGLPSLGTLLSRTMWSSTMYEILANSPWANNLLMRLKIPRGGNRKDPPRMEISRIFFKESS
jgi:hypothetical protein